VLAAEQGRSTHGPSRPRPTVAGTRAAARTRVRAAGVNRADLTQRRGGYGRPDFGDSTLMGLEIAGEVIAAGPAVSGFHVGDHVMGVVGGGAYAEVARIDHRMAIPIPARLDMVHAAAVPEAFVTAHEALIHLADLQSHETVLIHAASGGVGSAAVQLARAVGATIIATSEAEKLDRVRALGAAVCVDYQTQDFAEAVAKATGSKGVDVVIDFIGAPYLERNVRSLAEGGRLVQVGLPLDLVLFRHLRIMGTVMKSRPQEIKHAMVARFRERWLAPLGRGEIVPAIDGVFPLERAADAHRRMEEGKSFGKIILAIPKQLQSASNANAQGLE
jgi:NADPH:quinone reductase